MKLSHTAFACLLTLSASPTLVLADTDDGKELHDETCVRCHDSSNYTRDNRKVTSLPALGTQVRMCKTNLGLTWFDDEVNDVIGYLNKEYYHFDMAKGDKGE
ncbi:MAG: cytochrome c [Gammaproteobacteria bacterium]|nr:cytochrome c [Gammaproteobacteria bacterium]